MTSTVAIDVDRMQQNFEPMQKQKELELIAQSKATAKLASFLEPGYYWTELMAFGRFSTDFR